MQLYRGIYLCLGYPNLGQSLKILQILHGHPNIDFIELGLPFSDPVADGPVISEAAQIALLRAKEQNISPRQMLARALAILGDSHKDIYLMTYGNMVYHLQQKYPNFFKQLPVKGLIIPDAPLREHKFFRTQGLRQTIVPFATPESTPRDLQDLAQTPAPFIYFVAARGITGSLTDFASPKLRQQYAALQKAVKQSDSKNSPPVVLGFGVRGAAQIKQLAEFADNGGFVIGTAAVQRQEDCSSYRQFLDSLAN